jgi:hypothetical protein
MQTWAEAGFVVLQLAVKDGGARRVLGLAHPDDDDVVRSHTYTHISRRIFCSL